MQEAAESDSASIAAARSQKALENLRQQQQQLNEQGERSVNQLAQNLGQRGQQLLQQQRQLQERIAETSRQQGLGQTRQSVRNDESLQELIQAQQQQQRGLEEIEDMLRAIIARGSNEDQRLMSQAQEASRDLRPIREEMSTSSRVLRNGMVNLAVDIEEEIEDQLVTLADSLAGLDPANQGSESDQLQRAADDAENLREQIESLQQQALVFNDSGSEQGTQPSLRDMREQLQRSQQLAEQLQDQLRDQARGGQQSTQAGQAGARGNRQQIGVPEAKVSSAPARVGRSTPTATICPGEMPGRSGSNSPSRTSKISSINRSCFDSCSSRLSSSKVRCALKPNSTTSKTSCMRLSMKRCLRSIGTWFRNTIVYCQKVRV